MAGSCRTPDDAFRAGYEAPCQHGIPDPDDCPQCRLTDAEIARLVVMLRPLAAAGRRLPEAA